MRISRDRMENWASGDQDALLSLFIPERDYEELNLQNAQLRVWLPDAAKLAMEEVAERAETSMTVYLTEYFATYLFGYHELLRMRETRTGLYEPSRTKRSMMSAGPPEQPPKLGKNIFALKIFVPEKIKQGLQLLAIRAELSLGEFTRALICAHLFGREYGPQKFVALSPSTTGGRVRNGKRIFVRSRTRLKTGEPDAQAQNTYCIGATYWQGRVDPATSG